MAGRTVIGSVALIGWGSTGRWHLGLLVCLVTLSWSAGASEMNIDLNAEAWRAVNDGVMGGVSASEMAAHDRGLRFHGKLSLENNGGFASVRRMINADLENARGVRLAVKGDGRRYQFRLRTNTGFNSIAWRHRFTTTGEWQTVELIFDDFEPVFRGRKISGVAPLQASDIRQFGFMLADGKPGPFQLDIVAIELWSL